MFDKEISFTGKHADYLRRLAPSKQYTVKDAFDRSRCFQSNIDVVLAAAIVGFIKGRKAARDATVNVADNRIHLEALINNKESLELVYRIIMLLDRKDDLPINARIDKAFRYDNNLEKRADGDKVFWEYVRGGIEYLYETLLADSENSNTDVQNMMEFVEDYKQCYYEADMLNKIYELCKGGIADHR